MEPITGVVAGGLAIVAMILFLKVMNLSGDLAKTRDDAERIQRELRKVSQQLEANRSKYQEKAQEASTKGTKAKGQKQRIAQLSNDLQGAKSELGKVQAKVKDYSGQLTKLRIEREELRTALNAAKRTSQPTPLSEPKAATAAVVEDTTDAQERVTNRTGQPNSDRLQRDLERAQGKAERMQDALTSLKKKLVQTISESRTLRRKNEHNRRAYIITQLQLDRTIDENYLLKHGTPPPNPQAERADRKAISDAVERTNVVVNREADPIQLPSAEELEALEAAPHAAIIGHVSDEEIAEMESEVSEALVEESIEPEAEGELVEAAPAADEVAPEPAEEPAAPEVTDEAPLAARPQPADASVKRRRKPKTEELEVSDAPAVPPRPGQ